MINQYVAVKRQVRLPLSLGLSSVIKQSSMHICSPVFWAVGLQCKLSCTCCLCCWCFHCCSYKVLSHGAHSVVVLWLSRCSAGIYSMASVVLRVCHTELRPVSCHHLLAQPYLKKKKTPSHKQCGISQYLKTFFHSCFSIDVGLSRRRTCVHALLREQKKQAIFIMSWTFKHLVRTTLWCVYLYSI